MDLCDRLGVGYFRRDDRRGAKAGNANRALARTTGEFVAIFDADHAPHPDFLVTMLRSALAAGDRHAGEGGTGG